MVGISDYKILEANNDADRAQLETNILNHLTQGWTLLDSLQVWGNPPLTKYTQTLVRYLYNPGVAVISDYKILSSSMMARSEFETSVKEALQKGWILHSPLIRQHHDNYANSHYIQVIVKYY